MSSTWETDDVFTVEFNENSVTITANRDTSANEAILTPEENVTSKKFLFKVEITSTLVYTFETTQLLEVFYPCYTLYSEISPSLIETNSDT